MRFDLNLGEVPELTVAMRFAQKTANDAGEPIQPQVARIFMFELKKFLFLCALEINKNKRLSSEAGEPKPVPPFECPFVPPPHIDLAWRHLLTF